MFIYYFKNLMNFLFIISLTDICDITLHHVLEKHQIVNGTYPVIDSNSKVINHHKKK